jgi:hypothetical protein
MADTILPSYFNFDLTRAEEIALAVCIDLAADLYSKNSHYSQYHQRFTNDLQSLVSLYQDEMHIFGAAPADIIEVTSNYDYARIIKTGLTLMRQAHFLPSDKVVKFVYTVKNLLDNASIIAEVVYKRHPIAHEYFSQQYDSLYRFINELSHYLKVNEQRRAGDGSN